jgi:lysophospholipase L1-like esterase
MKKIKYVALSLLTFALVACDNDLVEDLRDIRNLNVEPLPELSIEGTGLDFSNYVAVGASYTAGYSDGAVFKAAQEKSFPKLLATKFAAVGGGDFKQPLRNDNTGGMLLNGVVSSAYRLIFNGAAPQRLNDFLTSKGLPVPPITTDASEVIEGPFNNMGVPGAKSYTIDYPGYGTLDPDFGRMASSPGATILGDAVSQNPTFFTVFGVGGNDVLSYAYTGGIGTDQTGNPDPSTYSPIDITAPAVFNASYDAIVSQLTANGAKGALGNLPYVTVMPFFTTVPNNALVLDAAQAAGLTGVFQAVSGIFLQGAILQGVPQETAQALAAQYLIEFNEGPNRWIIDVPVTQTNPLGFRQMTEDELVLLTIDQTALAEQGYGSVALTDEVLQVLAILQGGGTPTPDQANLVLASVNGIDDDYVLDSDELASIKNATDAYNQKVADLADEYNLALVDFKGIVDLGETGLTDGDFTLTTALVTGGLFSLDGIHLTSRGYAFMANAFMEALDAKYGSNFEASGNLLNIGDYPTNYSPMLP